MVLSVSARQVSRDGLDTSEALARMEPDDVSHETKLAALERLIERVGARYIADLRELSEEFSRFYEAQLEAKDGQIAELARRAEAAERAKNDVAARLDELRHARSRQVAELRALSEELVRRVAETEHEHHAPDSAPPL
jgi:chromosome segregation ATPase